MKLSDDYFDKYYFSFYLMNQNCTEKCHTTVPGNPLRPSVPGFPGCPCGPTGPVFPGGPRAPESP